MSMSRDRIGKDFVGVATPFYCCDNQGRILFQLRSSETRDESGRWDSGSGKLEKGLSLEKNVKKEVKEELGAECSIFDRLPAHGVFREHEGEKTHWLVIPFFVKVESEEVSISEPEKIDELRWAEPGNFPKPLHKGFKRTFRNYREKFEDVLKRERGGDK